MFMLLRTISGALVLIFSPAIALYKVLLGPHDCYYVDQVKRLAGYDLTSCALCQILFFFLHIFSLVSSLFLISIIIAIYAVRATR